MHSLTLWGSNAPLLIGCSLDAKNHINCKSYILMFISTHLHTQYVPRSGALVHYNVTPVTNSTIAIRQETHNTSDGRLITEAVHDPVRIWKISKV